MAAGPDRREGRHATPARHPRRPRLRRPGQRCVIQAGDALTFVIDVVSVEGPPVITAPPMADPAECPATDGPSRSSRSSPRCSRSASTSRRRTRPRSSPTSATFTIEFDADKAPQTVNNFVTLARYHYFDDTQCHRVDHRLRRAVRRPDGDGNGGPGYVIPDELPLAGEYQLGSIAMANAGARHRREPVLHHLGRRRRSATARVQPVRSGGRRPRT